VYLQPLVTEVSHGDVTEIGTEKSKLAQEFPEIRSMSGWDELDEVWWPQTIEHSLGGPTSVRRTRVAAFEQWLESKPEKLLAIISHGAFLLNLSEHKRLDSTMDAIIEEQMAGNLSSEEATKLMTESYMIIRKQRELKNFKSRWITRFKTSQPQKGQQRIEATGLHAKL
jgi:hypothetical protein